MISLLSVEFGLFLGGLACLFLGGLAASLGLRRLRRMPWPCLASFGFGFGAAQWMSLWGRLRDVPTAFDAAQLALAAAALMSLCEFGRRGLHTAGRRIPKRFLYGPIALLLAAATWAAVAAGEIAGLQTVCRYTLGLPAGLLAGLALLGVSPRRVREARESNRSGALREAVALSRPVDEVIAPVRNAPSTHGFAPRTLQQGPLRWAGAGLLLWTVAFGLIVPAAGFFPASWLNDDAFFAATRVPVELLAAVCLLATMVGLWWHQRGPEWAVQRPSLVRRWLLPVAFVILTGCGWVTTARLVRSLDAGEIAVTVVAAGPAGEPVGEATGIEPAGRAETPAGWSKMSSRRLHSGLPIVIIAFLVLGGAAAVAAKLADRHP